MLLYSPWHHPTPTPTVPARLPYPVRSVPGIAEDEDLGTRSWRWGLRRHPIFPFTIPNGGSCRLDRDRDRDRGRGRGDMCGGLGKVKDHMLASRDRRERQAGGQRDRSGHLPRQNIRMNVMTISAILTVSPSPVPSIASSSAPSIP